MRLLVCLLIAVIAGVTSQAVAAQRTDGLLKDCEGRDYRLCLGYIMGFYDGRTTQDYGKLTGANLCPKKKPLEAAPDYNPGPWGASTPKEAMALAIKFLEGLKPPDVEEPEEEA